MDIVISPETDKPIYQQIFEQISAQIIKGTLTSGACLPPIRTVAKELRISVITVKKAWEELENAGFIHTVGGKGCFVANLETPALVQKKNLMAEEKLRTDLMYYKTLGLTENELISLVKKNFYIEEKEES